MRNLAPEAHFAEETLEFVGVAVKDLAAEPVFRPGLCPVLRPPDSSYEWLQ